MISATTGGAARPPQDFGDHRTREGRRVSTAFFLAIRAARQRVRRPRARRQRLRRPRRGNSVRSPWWFCSDSGSRYSAIAYLQSESGWESAPGSHFFFINKRRDIPRSS